MKIILYLIFMVLACMDFVGTVWLGAGELNPLAAWVWQELGWLGLGGYKVVIAAVTIGLVQILWTKQPKKAWLVMEIACFSTAAMVLLEVAMLAWYLIEVRNLPSPYAL